MYVFVVFGEIYWPSLFNFEEHRLKLVLEIRHQMHFQTRLK